MSRPACKAAQAKDVELALRTRKEMRQLGIRMPLLTGVTEEDTEGADEIPIPSERLFPCEPEDGTFVSRPTDIEVNEGGDTGGVDSESEDVEGEDIGDGYTGGEDEAAKANDENHGECGRPFVEIYHDARAGAPKNDDRSKAFNLRAHMRSVGRMASPAVFHVAELLMTTKMSNAGRDAHLKSRVYRNRSPWTNVGAMMKDIDNLPHGPAWKAVTMRVQEGEDERIVVVYTRDIIEVIRELIGNERFKGHMRYAPERHWTSNARRKRVFGEMWTGDWWWEMQDLLSNPNATIAPLIVASDKTTLSMVGGDQAAYPVYLTIGNISKRLRRKATQRATILIGYLPVENFADVPDENERERLKGELVHRAMEILMEPLKKAGRDGVDMYCADGRLRTVYPILAAYVADFPEQCLMACTSQGRCPICTVPWRQRARYRDTPGRRKRKFDVEALRSYMETNDLGELKDRGLKPWWPFWADLPHVEFGGCITPDLLHQLHKGIFKSHLVKWVSFMLQAPVVDRRMAAMTRASGLRHFQAGISTVQKWTGRESKEMGMQFLPVVAESTSDDLVRLTRAVLDHMYRGHAARMTEDELEDLEEAWREFHRRKIELVRLGAMREERFFNRISKMHTVLHWPQSIRKLGTPDGYNTEAPEHLHIEYAKEPWRWSNGVDALPQMIKFIQRQEAIRIHRAHLNAYLELIRRTLRRRERELAGVEGDTDDEEDEDIDDEGWEDVAGDSEDTADAVHYPDPGLAIALRPTCPNLPANQIIEKYKAPELIPALTKFLESQAGKAHGQSRPDQSDRLRVPHLTGYHLFNVWHRFALFHNAPPFAPDEPTRRDVVRARPATRNALGLLSRQAAFDTVLYQDPDTSTDNVHGLHCYRAARVRVIFTPPSTVRHIYREQLAYIEFFTPFSRNNNTPHGMYTTSTALYPNGLCQVAVVPIDHIRMACHIAPRYSKVSPNLRLNRHTDLLVAARHFFFNHYANHYLFKLFEHWRKRAPR